MNLWNRHTVPVLAALASIVVCSSSIAGEIAGLRPQLPAFLQPDLDVILINDFLGRGGSTDDFRTQQSIISARFADRWIATVDHSILTLADEPSPGRIDQLSVSLGYELTNRHTDTRSDRLVVGTGLRSVGQFAGERIQNGFHRIVGSGIEELAYTDTTGSDLTVWFDAERYRMLRDSTDSGLLEAWRIGYQLRASSLLTGDGQWDSAISMHAVMSKPAVDIWLGVRSDWRDGYDDPVLRETASEEEDVAVVLGARIGPLVVETVQQFNNNASYGQIRLVSSANDAHGIDYGRSRWGLDFGVLLPDVQLRLSGRLPTRILTTETSRWRESLILGLGYGQPQYQDDTSLYTRSRQVDASIEFERPLSADNNWLSAYGSAGAGWRDEKLTGDGELQGESSGAVGRVVLTASAGLRFRVFSYRESWRFRVQFGLVGRVPVDGADVQIADQSYRIQRSAFDLMLGVSFDFE